MYGKAEVEIRKICIYECDFLKKYSSDFKITINFADQAAEKNQNYNLHRHRYLHGRAKEVDLKKAHNKS